MLYVKAQERWLLNNLSMPAHEVFVQSIVTPGQQAAIRCIFYKTVLISAKSLYQ